MYKVENILTLITAHKCIQCKKNENNLPLNGPSYIHQVNSINKKIMFIQWHEFIFVQKHENININRRKQVKIHRRQLCWFFSYWSHKRNV